MFTKILYINLDRRQDRNKNVLEQLKKINYNGNIERISAVDAIKLNFNIIPKTLITDEGLATTTSKDMHLYTYLTKGAIGCALSHKIVFEKVLYGNNDYVLILEDNMWFIDNFNNKLKKVLANFLDSKYDILWLGYHNKKNELKVYAVNENNRLILSDTLQTSITFGTNIQRRDMFSNTYNQICFAESITFSKLLAVIFAIWIIYITTNNLYTRVIYI